MQRSVGKWWDARVVVVTPKAVIAVGPAAKVLAKALFTATV